MNYPINNLSTPGFFDRLFDPTYWLIGIVIFIVIYFALREFRCWYFKTNKIIKLLEEIKQNITSNKNQEQKSSIKPPENTNQM